MDTYIYHFCPQLFRVEEFYEIVNLNIGPFIHTVHIFDEDALLEVRP